MEAYIADIAVFLPNAPVDNDKIEKILGKIAGLPSRTKKIILKNNGIKQRHYALNLDTGVATHTNIDMIKNAIDQLVKQTGVSISDIELLACGTSSPDQILPGQAIMVHGKLPESKAIETVSTSGICLSAVKSLKYAVMSVALGLAKKSIATGSESASSYMRAGMFENKDPNPGPDDPDNTPYFSFEADFLRWMLSDGAAACLVTDKPISDKLSLRIDWIDILSQAHRKEACMFSGAVKQKNGELKGFREFDSLHEAVAEGAFPVKQDAKILNSDIIKVIIDDTLQPLVKKYDLQPENIDWFLPHYSSEYFRQKVYDQMAKIGFEIDFDRWFTNLTSKGNTGSASIFIMLEELLHSSKLQKGQTILCMIPESGRFSCGYMQLTVV